MSVINLKELEDAIKMIEDLLKTYNIEERELIIKNVANRLAMERQKSRQSQLVNETVSKLSIKGLMDKMMKRDKE